MAETPAPAEPQYRYDDCRDIRMIRHAAGVHVEFDCGDDVLYSYWLVEWRRGIRSPAYGGRPGARDVWLPRRDRPVRIEREQWAALAYDEEQIKTAELEELRARITVTLDEAFAV